MNANSREDEESKTFTIYPRKDGKEILVGQLYIWYARQLAPIRARNYRTQ